MNLLNIGSYASDGRWREVSEALAHSRDELTPKDLSVVLCELAYYGKLQVVTKLLDMGADPNFRYDLAEESRLAYILQGFPRTTPVGQTILGSSHGRSQTVDALRILLAKGASPDGFTYQGYTPLQLAIMENCREHAAVLLGRHADPMKRCEDPLIPEGNAFHFAELAGKWAVDLLKHDQDPR